MELLFLIIFTYINGKWLFVQQFVQTANYTGPLWGESTSDQWIPVFHANRVSKSGSVFISWRHDMTFTSMVIGQSDIFSSTYTAAVMNMIARKKTSSHKLMIPLKLYKAQLNRTHILWEVLHDLYMYLLISGGIWDFARSNVHPFNEAVTHSWASLTLWVTTIYIHLSVRMFEPTIFPLCFIIICIFNDTKYFCQYSDIVWSSWWIARITKLQVGLAIYLQHDNDNNLT